MSEKTSKKASKKASKSSSKKTSKKKDKKCRKKLKTEKKKAKKINENYEQLSKKYAILEEKYEYLKKVCMTYKIAQEETKAKSKQHLSPRARDYYNELLSKVNLEKAAQKSHEERSLLDSSYDSNSFDETFVNSLQTKLAATKSKNESPTMPGSLSIESSITDNDENTIYDSGYLNSNNSSNKTESYMTNQHN